MQNTVLDAPDHKQLNADGTSNLMTIILMPFGAEGMNVPTLSTRQIVCSPSLETKEIDGRYHSLKMPGGLFDLVEALAILPPEQKPEAIIVWSDATAAVLPINLAAFTNCRKLLMIGDTHHQVRPLQTMLIYAASNPFDTIILMFRQHLHFFQDAGFANAYWIQGQMTNPDVKTIPAQRDRRIVLLGNSADLHPQRRKIVDALETADYPLVTGFYSHADAMETYAKVQISLNVSLNGDMNWRPYEVIGAGGFLITDRLSHFSGMDILFKEDEHYVSFGSIDELKAKLDYYLDHPDDCLAIATRAQQHYLKHFNRQSITRAVWNLLLGDRSSDLFHVDNAERLNTKYANNVDILPRVALYETVQEQHRVKSEVRLLFLNGSSALTISDCADLPRVSIFIESETGMPIDFLKDIAPYKPVSYVPQATACMQSWDVVVAGYPADAQAIADRYDPAVIMITDAPWVSDQPPLSDFPQRYTPSKDGYAIFEKRPAINLGTYSQKYGNMGGDISNLSMSVGLREKRILEIGGCAPWDLVINAAAVQSWIGLIGDHDAAPDAVDVHDAAALKSLESIPDYACFRAAITDLPDRLQERFDLVYISQGARYSGDFLTLLKTAMAFIRPGGKLCIAINPAWTAQDGHDLPVIIDQSGHEFSREKSGIPPWGHLLMTEAELTRHLQTQTDAGTAAKIAHHVYHAPVLNRLMIEDYDRCINQIRFKTGNVKALLHTEVPPDIQSRLQEKYPGCSKFDHGGILYVLRK